MGWWRRLLYRRLVSLVAWGLRRGITADRTREALAQSFGHRPPEWREDVIEDAQAANRSRLMAGTGA